MPLMKSPYAGKPVTVSDEQVARYAAAGFSVVEPVEPVGQSEKKPARKRRAD
jgi:hypothetical protein